MDTHPRLQRRSRAPLIAAIVALTMLTTTMAAYLRLQKEKAEQARQREMSEAVASLRAEIAQFRAKQGRYPRALSELPRVPRDPVTGSHATWQTEMEESVSADDFTAKAAKPERFVVNVRSGAKGADANGKAWSDY